MKHLLETDWEAELQGGDTMTRRENNEEIQVVLLAGLQRLAREAGLKGQSCIIQTPKDSMVQAIYTAVFKLPNEEGTFTSVGAADCNIKNTSKRFAIYPTAIAESRAEARCLRKALGIRMLSSEELGLREGFSELEASPTGKADNQLVVTIQKLCTSKGVDPAAVLEEVIEDKERASSIFELSELTMVEARRAMAWLNEQKEASKGGKKQTAKEKRDARKKELQDKEKEDK